MTELEKILAMIKLETDIEVKAGLATSLLAAIEHRRVKLNKEEKNTVGEFALGELDGLIEDIRGAKSYKDKVPIIRYEDTIIGFLIICYDSPANVPEEKQLALRELALLVENERKLENEISDFFEKDEITTEDTLSLLELVASIEEEYHRGALYAGFLHYSSDISKISEQPKAIISRFFEAELDRYIAKKDSLTEDEECNLEYLVDLASHFLTERMTEQLSEVLTFASKEISLFTIKTLAQTERDIPKEIIERLAKDTSCAVVLYHSLKKAGKLELIPAEYATDDYIARSDMTRWLEYPTELGKTPTELELLGVKNVKRHPFHIFRFRSDSENLPEEKRGKWLIGWSSFEIGTFSPFEEYEKYEKKNVEKTLAYIARKLIR